MRVLNDDTQELLGHMVEISSVGLKLETIAPLPIDKDYYLRLELTADLADLPYIVLIARTKWCEQDTIELTLYRVGFELVEIMPEDRDIFVRILEKFGK